MKTTLTKQERLSKHQRKALEFFATYEGIHAYDRKCQLTKRTVKGMAAKGLLVVNKYNQARITGKGKRLYKARVAK